MSYLSHNKNQMELTIRNAKMKEIDILLKYLKTRKLIFQRNKKLKAHIYASTLKTTLVLVSFFSCTFAFELLLSVQLLI